MGIKLIDGTVKPQNNAVFRDHQHLHNVGETKIYLILGFLFIKKKNLLQVHIYFTFYWFC